MATESRPASPRARTGPSAGIGLKAALVGGVLGLALAGSAVAQDEDWAAVEAAAEQEKTIVLYSPASDLADALIAGFLEKYPWADIKTVTASAGTIASRAVTEAKAGAPTADVLIVPRGNQKALLDNDVVVVSEVPHDATMSPENFDASLRSHPIYVNPITILYNTNALTEADIPKDIYELADPKWKGKIAFDRPSNGAVAASFLSSPRKAWGDEKWRAWLEGLKANDIFITPDGTSAYQAALRGEVQIAVQSANQLMVQAEGTPMAAAVYDDLVYFVQSVWLPRGAAHPNAGKLFIDWLISPEGQQVLSDSGRAPALRSVPSPLDPVMPDTEVVPAPADSLDDFYADPDKYLSVYGELWPS